MCRRIHMIVGIPAAVCSYIYWVVHITVVSSYVLRVLTHPRGCSYHYYALTRTEDLLLSLLRVHTYTGLFVSLLPLLAGGFILIAMGWLSSSKNLLNVNS